MLIQYGKWLIFPALLAALLVGGFAALNREIPPSKSELRELEEISKGRITPLQSVTCNYYFDTVQRKIDMVVYIRPIDNKVFIHTQYYDKNSDRYISSVVDLDVGEENNVVYWNQNEINIHNVRGRVIEIKSGWRINTIDAKPDTAYVNYSTPDKYGLYPVKPDNFIVDVSRLISVDGIVNERKKGKGFSEYECAPNYEGYRYIYDIPTSK